MKKVNIILQGKGGVGKSFIAASLAQYQKQTTGVTPLCIDTDPVNATLKGFDDLHVKLINIMENDEINPRLFDELIESVLAHDGDSIIDNGASSFVPLAHYLISNNVSQILHDSGYEMIIHTVITGGQAMDDTINGFVSLSNSFASQLKIAVWLNPYFGNIERDGKKFIESKFYSSNKSRISSLVIMPTWKRETFGYDISECLKRRHTFDQGITDKNLNIMARQRLKIAKEQLFNSLSLAFV